MLRLGIALSLAGSLALGLACRPRPPRDPSPIDMPLYPLVDPDGPITKSERAPEQQFAPRETARCIDSSVTDGAEDARDSEEETAKSLPGHDED